MVINETVLSTTLHNRTFEEDLGYVTDLVTRLTHEVRQLFVSPAF